MQGFADRTTGGRGGAVYWVTHLEDAGEGSLRRGAASQGPRWIRFAVSGDLDLGSPLTITSNLTIDGRGAKIRIRRFGFVIDGHSNVIIENLIFEDGEDDAIRMVNGARRLWIDHCSFARWKDGQIDITRAATDVTVSWSRFSDQDKVMLISAGPDAVADRDIRVTLHHNYFNRTVERHPRLRFGKVHAYNNYYYAWRSYGAAASMFGELLSQANIFDAGWDKEALLTRAGRDPEHGFIRSVGDRALHGARLDEREPARVFDPAAYYSSAVVEPADECLRARVRDRAGWRDVRIDAGAAPRRPAGTIMASQARAADWCRSRPAAPASLLRASRSTSRE